LSEEAFQKFYKYWLEATKGYVAPWLHDSTGEKDRAKPQNPFPFPGVDLFSQPNSLFERMIWFPPFSVIQGTASPAIQNYAKYADITKASIELYQKWLELYLEFSRAMADVGSKLNERFLGSGASTDPKRAYAIWVEEYAQGMDKMLRDDRVALKMTAFLSNLLDLKRQADDFMESYYEAMNIPTRSEMDRVYKEIYVLKKELRKLRSSMKKNSDEDETSD
jgi:hypothetical protein